MALTAQLMPFDELNALREKLTYSEFTREDGKKDHVQDYDELADEIEDILLLSYLSGRNAANEMLGTDINVDIDRMWDAIYHEIDGKDWRERLQTAIDKGGSVEDIMRIAETESHRDLNEGIFDTAERSGKAVNKTWQTMRDDRVREAHDYMQGQTVPFNAPFVTYDGSEAQFPGGFGIPELDVNCRCYISVS